jgi:hypothetical protein
MVLGLFLSIAGIGALCWLMFAMAVYMLPCCLGTMAGIGAYHTGSGVIGAIIVGFAAAAASWFMGQLALTMIRSLWIRGAIVLAFAAPATVAGYSATLQLFELGTPSPIWSHIFAVIGGAFVGCTALVRLTGFAAIGSEANTATAPAPAPLEGDATT